MLLNLFPTPVWVNDPDPQTLARIQDQITAAIIDLDITGKPWDDSAKSTFTFEGVNDIDGLGLTELKTWIHYNLMAFFELVSYRGDPQITHSWFNRFDQGDFMYDHCHPESLISGSYYYHSEDQGGLRFSNPNPLMWNRLWPSDQQPWQQGHVIETKTGRLVLFPSWLQHRVRVNTQADKEPRISIAFNLS